MLGAASSNLSRVMYVGPCLRYFFFIVLCRQTSCDGLISHANSPTKYLKGSYFYYNYENDSLLVCCTLMMGGISSSETSVSVYQKHSATTLKAAILNLVALTTRYVTISSSKLEQTTGPNRDRLCILLINHFNKTGEYEYSVGHTVSSSGEIVYRY